MVNTWERSSVERWIFTAAHELGHLLLHFEDYGQGIKEEDKAHEREADAFAAEFLMPDGSLSVSGLSLVAYLLWTGLLRLNAFLR